MIVVGLVGIIIGMFLGAWFGYEAGYNVIENKDLEIRMRMLEAHKRKGENE